MSSVNRVFIIGHLGADPERKTTRTGTEMTTFSVATNEGPRDNPTTHWHSILVFGNTAELCEKYLGKGSRVCVEGRVSYNTWQDDDGRNHKYTRIIASSVHFLSTKPQGSATEEDRASFAEAAIPF